MIPERLEALRAAVVDETHREHLPESRAPAPFRAPVMRTVHVASDDAEARRALEGLRAEFGARGRGGRGALARAARGPLEERVVVGGASRVSDTLAAYRERLGMDLLIARAQIPGVASSEQEASLERLSGEVLPSLTGGA